MYYDLTIPIMEDTPNELTIPRQLYDKILNYFDNLSFESKLELLLTNVAEEYNPVFDFESKGANVFRKLLMIKDNPKSKDIIELIEYLDD